MAVLAEGPESLTMLSLA